MREVKTVKKEDKEEKGVVSNKHISQENIRTEVVCGSVLRPQPIVLSSADTI